MLSVVNVCTTAPVNALVVQNAETSSTASEPRYATTSQAIGGTSSNARLMRRPSDAEAVGSVGAAPCHPLICCHLSTHSL